jgi:hypothetical protein
MNLDYSLVEKKDLQYYTFHELKTKNIFYGFTTKNWTKLSLIKNLKLEKNSIISLRQIHSDKFYVVNNRPEKILVGDALITKKPGLVLSIRTADCLPILIFNDKYKIVSAIHTGWKGTAKKITLKVLQKISEEFGIKPSSLSVLLGPSICRKCYEVGKEVKEVFKVNWKNLEYFLTLLEKNRYSLDLKKANLMLLMQAKVNKNNVFSINLCTKCHPELFFSHRRKPKSKGRMIAFIGIK